MHLKRSDPKPPIDPNRLTLIGFRFCPYVDRVKLVLSYYKVDYDLINISLISKPDWFLEMYPTGKVPLLLLQNGQKLPESDIIMRYIDKIYGSEALLSHCGVGEFEKAKELVNQISRSTYMIISVPEINPCDISHYRQACSQINEAIKGPYFTGSNISLADLIVFPHLHRLETIMGRIHGKKPEEIKELNTNDELCKEWPKLTAFLNIMREQTFVADVTIPCRIHAEYAATVASGCNNPDIE
ncbi:Glutathione S-transferase omega-1 isoform 1 [Schistosoma japonicum]|uniref:Glutathione S-transferase omega-1 isoform 1 n=2 Tax=Schistosoma japonicum TaxID=6182 RepID=C1LI77_SCHJA|nr:Pyrimidodiazepine synthase [Schistosoma japonicum]KAH8858595.1 Pyrimidodiazepine synthase [Schistosoma japonicum]KAH8858596.1 Pyrimidodiazepine synthase [Schistosoma japonicum]KAH8858597.1 Pyrimidodiazepine synthase [Schistosoma japonicum]KAH8858598.1 Pyrimidodiazepine synthase [Schistosoma japonicum]